MAFTKTTHETIRRSQVCDNSLTHDVHKNKTPGKVRTDSLASGDVHHTYRIDPYLDLLPPAAFSTLK
jgi:hypothetical protein